MLASENHLLREIDRAVDFTSVKAVAFLLNQSCNVSIDRVRTFLRDVSDGKIRISNGMICNLARQFSRNTEAERNELFLKHLGADVLHADFTFARKKGKQTVAMITATEDSVLYQARPRKGDEGVKGTPVELYNGTMVSDHEPAIVKHGKRRQECTTFSSSGIRLYRQLIISLNGALGSIKEKPIR